MIFQFDQVISFFDRLKISPGTKLAKVKEQEIHGITAECSGIFFKHFEQRHEFCFDPATGYLIRETDPTWFTTLEFGDYATVATKTFPRTLRVLQDGQLMVEVRVTELTPNPKTSDDQFAALSGIQPSPGSGCENGQVERAHVVKRVLPRYPPDALRNRISGTVTLYAEIGKDRIPRGLIILRSPGPEFSESSLAAVGQWRYEPTTCKGNPVAVATAIDVNFSVRE